MINVSDRNNDVGIRKAAILVASLDQDAADRLMDQLDPPCAELVREAVMALDDVDPEEQRRIVAEFRRIGPMVPDRCPAGIELDDPMVERYLAAARKKEEIVDSFEISAAYETAASQETMPTVEQPSAEQPFGFLQQTEEQDLFQLLSDERPQTIALVLSHVSPPRAGEVLAMFLAKTQVEVVRRLLDLDDTDPETLRHVEEALESRLQRQVAVSRARSAGPEAVSRIFASCNSQVVGGILGNLAVYDRSLAEKFGHRTLRFGDLASLDGPVLRATVRATEPEVLHAALVGAPTQLVERILSNMPPEVSRQLRCKLDFPDPIRLSDIEDARQRMALAAERAMYSPVQKRAKAA